MGLRKESAQYFAIMSFLLFVVHVPTTTTAQSTPSTTPIATCAYKEIYVDPGSLQYGNGGWINTEFCTDLWVHGSTSVGQWNLIVPGGVYKFRVGIPPEKYLINFYTCPTNDCTNYYTNTWVASGAISNGYFERRIGQDAAKYQGGFTYVSLTSCASCWRFDSYYEFTFNVNPTKWMWIQVANTQGATITPDVYIWPGSSEPITVATTTIGTTRSTTSVLAPNETKVPTPTPAPPGSSEPITVATTTIGTTRSTVSVLAPNETQVPTPTPAPSTQDGLPIGAIVAIVLVGIGGVGTGIGLILYYAAKKTTVVTPEKAKKDPETGKPTQSAVRDVMDVKILPLETSVIPGRYLEAPSREHFHYQKSSIISEAPTEFLQ